MVLPIRLSNTHVQLTGTNCVDVVDRTAGRFDRATHAMRLAAFVNQATDRAARRIVNASDTAGADGNELLLLEYNLYIDVSMVIVLK